MVPTFGVTELMFARTMMDDHSNAEYKHNPPIHSDASEAHIHTYVRTYILSGGIPKTIFHIQGCWKRVNPSNSWEWYFQFLIRRAGNCKWRCQILYTVSSVDFKLNESRWKVIGVVGIISLFSRKADSFCNEMSLNWHMWYVRNVSSFRFHWRSTVLRKLSLLPPSDESMKPTSCEPSNGADNASLSRMRGLRDW
jgi:hypothetical protein